MDKMHTSVIAGATLVDLDCTLPNFKFIMKNDGVCIYGVPEMDMTSSSQARLKISTIKNIFCKTFRLITRAKIFSCQNYVNMKLYVYKHAFQTL